MASVSHFSHDWRINTKIQKLTGLFRPQRASFLPIGDKILNWFELTNRWTDRQTKRTIQPDSLLFLTQQRIHLHHLERSQNGYSVKPFSQSLMQPIENKLLTLGKPEWKTKQKSHRERERGKTRETEQLSFVTWNLLWKPRKD